MNEQLVTPQAEQPKDYRIERAERMEAVRLTAIAEITRAYGVAHAEDTSVLTADELSDAAGFALDVLHELRFMSRIPEAEKMFEAVEQVSRLKGAGGKINDEAPSVYLPSNDQERALVVELVAISKQLDAGDGETAYTTDGAGAYYHRNKYGREVGMDFEGDL